MSAAHPDIDAIDAALATGERWTRLFNELAHLASRRAQALPVGDPKNLARVADDFVCFTRARREASAAQVRERLVDFIERESLPLQDRGRLIEALDRRLAVDAALVDLDDLPLRKTVMRICVERGVTPDWNRWEAGDWTTSDGLAPLALKPASPPPPKPIPALESPRRRRNASRHRSSGTCPA